MSNDCVMEMMEKCGILKTRDNYLMLAYFGTPPEVLDAEEEYSLPEEFQISPPENFE
jgi:hypothetical protein